MKLDWKKSAVSERFDANPSMLILNHNIVSIKYIFHEENNTHDLKYSMSSRESIKTELSDQQKNAFLGFKLWEEEAVHNKVLGHLAKIQDLRPRRDLPCQRGGSPDPLCTFLLTTVLTPALKSSRGTIFFSWFLLQRRRTHHTGPRTQQRAQGPSYVTSWNQKLARIKHVTRLSDHWEATPSQVTKNKSQRKKSHLLWLSSYIQF